MGVYINIILLVFISVAQVAWASFLLVGGFVIPILAIFIWWVYRSHNVTTAATYAFVGGLIVDLMGSARMGLHAFALLLALGISELVNKRLVRSGRLAEVVSLIILVSVYLLITINIS